MNRWWKRRLAGWLIGACLIGCTTVAVPPSESTMATVRSYQKQLEAKVASGQLTRAQARDLLYAKLAEIQPPLADLNELLEFRKQIASKLEAKMVGPEEAEALLAARESAMLSRWEAMAAKYDREEREFERIRQMQDRGFREEQAPMMRPPILPQR